MSVTLEVGLKDGKTSIKASIQGTIAEALSEYDQLTARFNGAPSPTPAATRSKKADTGTADEPVSTEAVNTENADGIADNVVDINKKPAATASQAKKLFSQQAVALNEQAVLKANRLALCIPQFNGKSALEIAQMLNYKKPLASMEPGELLELIGLINLTLQQYGANNPGVEAYLKVVYQIDHLQTGSAEEWAQIKAGKLDVDPTVWPVLAQPGNAVLFNAAKQYLAERQAVLQAVGMAAESA